MYYVNMEEIELRLTFMLELVQATEDLMQHWKTQHVLHTLAQERIMHLAIESVTDVGSYMIDGLMMREASSYEDIVDVLHGEQVFSDELHRILLSLVQLRRPLVQQYYSFEKTEQPHPILVQLPEGLTQFVDKVRRFLEKELKDFTS